MTPWPRVCVPPPSLTTTVLYVHLPTTIELLDMSDCRIIGCTLKVIIGPLGHLERHIAFRGVPQKVFSIPCDEMLGTTDVVLLAQECTEKAIGCLVQVCCGTSRVKLLENISH